MNNPADARIISEPDIDITNSISCVSDKIIDRETCIPETNGGVIALCENPAAIRAEFS